MTFARSPLTKLVRELIVAETGKLVGNSIAPDNAGWVGDPNAPASVFHPFVVLTPMTASGADGAFEDSQADRKIPYAVSSYGVDPDQLEWMADKARAAVAALAKTTVTLERDYRVQQVRVDQIGGIVRVDVSEPPYYGQMDQSVIWLTPSRG